MNQNTKNKVTIIALLAVFILPLVLSWFFYFYGDLSGDKKNHGSLIQPIRSLPDVELFDSYENRDKKLFGKWSIVYLHNGPCQQACVDNLYKLRQIRLATSKYAHRLQRVLILEQNTPGLYEQALSDEYKGQLLLFRDSLPDGFIDQFVLADETDPADKGRIYIIDPLGNLMMSYEADSDPIGIIEDLRLLIKVSRVG